MHRYSPEKVRTPRLRIIRNERAEDADEGVCLCGHPRHLHGFCNDTYPAMCSALLPHAADAEPSLEHVCMCLHFELDEDVVAASTVQVVAPPEQESVSRTGFSA